ncbi:MAG TPA: TonB-dependent receptor [Chitinophagaceae bacterium]|nr:TonB-dependent receptor [Chitinophagaceae bacterium]
MQKKTWPGIIWPILLAALILTKGTGAQVPHGLIRGRLLTAEGPAANFTVELSRTKRITQSDEAGYFVIRHLPALKDTLRVSSAVSGLFRQMVSLDKDQELDLGTIQLPLDRKALQEIRVYGRLTAARSDTMESVTKSASAARLLPQSTVVIDQEKISDRMEFTVKDALEDVPGIQAYSGYDEYSIRGFKAENARLINGLRGYATTYTSNLLVNVDRIEVVKGPVAALFGNGDPGGTINLVTKKPLEKTQGQYSLATGSWKQVRALLDRTGPLNHRKTLLYRINAGYDATHSFRDQLYGRSYQVAPSFLFRPSPRVTFQADLSYSHVATQLDRGQPGFRDSLDPRLTPVSLNVSRPGDYLHESDLSADLLVTVRILPHLQFHSGYLAYFTDQEAAGHGVHSYRSNDSVNLYFSRWDYQTRTNSLTNYLQADLHTGALAHQLMLGYDFVQSTVDLEQRYYERPDLFGTGSGIVGTFSLRHPEYLPRPVDQYALSDYESSKANVEGTAFHTQGLYIQEQARWGHWVALLGFRVESYRTGDEDATDTADLFRVHAFLPRVGLLYVLRPGISLYGTYSKGFDPFEASTNTQVFRDPFKPVNSELLEAGAKGNFLQDRLSASIALYQLKLSHVAVNANDLANPNLFVQQGEARSRGVESVLEGWIGRHWLVDLSYAYCVAKMTRSEVPSQVGEPMENAPRHTSNSWIRYEVSRGALKGLGLAVGHTQAGRRSTLQPGFELPGYVVVNAGLRYRYRQFGWALNLYNLGNATYWLGAYNNVNKWPGAPRHGMLSMHYRF